ncbi:MAG: o-succinylbenzoate synthase [Halobacteriales archaeon]
MRAELREFDLSLAEPLATAAGEIDRREGWLVRITTDDAIALGEATPLPGWTESPVACRDGLERAIERLEPDGPAEALDALDGTPAARHGLDGALADLRARRADEPLSRFLGGEGAVDRVPVNATIGDGDAADTVEAARDAVASGFSCLKIKVGNRPVDADVDRLRAVRETVGPSVAIRADANGAWSRDEAGAALSAFEPVGVEYVEQPLSADDLDGHADLPDAEVGIGLDESVVTVGIDAVLDAGIADVAILKPMVLGGPTRTIEAANRARAAGVEPVVTTTVDAIVARTTAVHCAAAIPNPSPSGLATGSMLVDDIGPDPAPIRDGTAVVPGEKGLGVAGVWDG